MKSFQEILSTKGCGMVGLSQVEENMEIKFEKKHQEAAFHGLCRIYSALWKQEIDSYESYGEETRWLLYPKMLLWYLMCLGKIN